MQDNVSFMMLNPILSRCPMLLSAVNHIMEGFLSCKAPEGGSTSHDFNESIELSTSRSQRASSTTMDWKIGHTGSVNTWWTHKKNMCRLYTAYIVLLHISRRHIWSYTITCYLYIVWIYINLYINHTSIIHTSFTNHTQIIHKSFTHHTQIIHITFPFPYSWHFTAR